MADTAPAAAAPPATPRQKPTFLVCYDGSAYSNYALDFTTKFALYKDRTAEAMIVHLFDDSKDYLPPNMRKAVVDGFLESYAVMHGRRVIKFVAPREPGKPAATTLVQIAQERKMGFIVMGFRGRKAAKKENLLASNVDYVMQYSKNSLIILSSEFKPYSGINYLVAVDAGKWSEKAIMDALVLASGDDKVTVVHALGGDEDEEKSTRTFQAMIQSARSRLVNPTHTDLKFVRTATGAVAETVLQYAEDTGAHILCVGTDAARLRRGHSYLGSVAAKLVINTTMPIIVAHFDTDFADVVEYGSQTRKSLR